MAISIVKTAKLGLATGSGTETLDFSSGASVLEDDLVIATAARQDFATALITDADGDYTQLDINTGSHSPGMEIAYRFMGSTPDTSVVINQVSSRGVAACLTVIRGVDTTTPFDVIHTSAIGVPSNMPDPPAITPVSDDCCILLVAGIDDDAVTDGGAPTNYSDFVGQEAIAGNLCSVFMASRILSGGADTEEDPGAFTGSGDDHWTAYTIALRPASGGGGPSFIPRVIMYRDAWQGWTEKLRDRWWPTPSGVFVPG